LFSQPFEGWNKLTITVTVEVHSPKGPTTRFGGAELQTWARHQLTVASDILDNPGGGLLFATQAIGQVGAALVERGAGKYAELAAVLERAEDHAVRREFTQARELVAQVLAEHLA
jgi:hypothetical protein